MPPPPSPRPYAVVDLDGVVADVRHRLPHVTRRPKDWDAFFAAAPQDSALAEGLAVARELARGHELVFLTGRPERCRADTQRWLDAHGLSGRLLMRREGDRRPARITKVERLRRLARERPVAVLIDDDDAVVTAARAAGFPVLHATWMSEAGTPEPLRASLAQAQEDEGRT